MIVKPNARQLTSAQMDTIDSAITSEPTTGEYKVKKLRLDTDRQTIMVTHSSVAEA